jgi:hypothetical protein
MKTAVLEAYNCSLAATCIRCVAALYTYVSILLLKWIIIQFSFFGNMLFHFNGLAEDSILYPRLGGQNNKIEKCVNVLYNSVIIIDILVIVARENIPCAGLMNSADIVMHSP